MVCSWFFVFFYFILFSKFYYNKQIITNLHLESIVRRSKRRVHDTDFQKKTKTKTKTFHIYSTNNTEQQQTHPALLIRTDTPRAPDSRSIRSAAARTVARSVRFRKREIFLFFFKKKLKKRAKARRNQQTHTSASQHTSEIHRHHNQTTVDFVRAQLLGHGLSQRCCGCIRARRRKHFVKAREQQRFDRWHANAVCGACHDGAFVHSARNANARVRFAGFFLFLKCLNSNLPRPRNSSPFGATCWTTSKHEVDWPTICLNCFVQSGRSKQQKKKAILFSICLRVKSSDLN